MSSQNNKIKNEMNRPNANSNQGTSCNQNVPKATTSKGANKLKIAHRTRSKYHLGEISIAAIGNDLPNDLLVNNNSNTDIMGFNERNNEQVEPFNLSSNLNSSHLIENYSNSASTPCNEDPQDDLWMEFLNSLQAPNQANPNNVTVTSTNSKIIDQDDADVDDPDFTLCLDNCDLDEPDYMDKWLQVPRREAILLVKDAIEFVDSSETKGNKFSKKKSTIQFAADQPISNQLSLPNQESNNQTVEKKLVSLAMNQMQIMDPNCQIVAAPLPIQQEAAATAIACNPSREYVPEFTEIQRKQLDEQLRNHVQLLTQVCMSNYNVLENSSVFTEAKDLLNVLDSMRATGNKSGKDPLEQMLSDNFEIKNLSEALQIVNNLPSLNLTVEKFLDPRKGLSSKVIDVIITSPVFYNVNLMPNNKYKYKSTFKRAIFSDTEKILLIMGFDKFKHLQKDECCQCIKEHLLPHRNCFDIKKQLNSISSSEVRQSCLKDLLRKQKETSCCTLKNFEFIPEKHYKSPLEQSENYVQLPSMYTLAIERLKMSRILKDSKKHVNQASTPAIKEPQKNSAGAVKLIKDMPQTSSSTENPINIRVEPELPINRENLVDIEDVENNSLEIDIDTEEPEIVICDSEDSPIKPPPKRKLQDLSFNTTFGSPEKSFQPKKFSTDRKNPLKKRRSNDSEQEQQNISLVQINNNNNANFSPFQSVASPVAKNPKNPSSITITSKITNQPITLQRPQLLTQSSFISNLTNASAHRSPIVHSQPTFHLGSNVDLSQLGQIITIPAPGQIQQTHQQQQPQLIIPAGFQGTILFQPTIYMGTKSSKDLSNFRKIVPKKKP